MQRPTREQHAVVTDTMQGRYKAPYLDYEPTGIHWGDGARVQQHIAAGQVPMHHIHAV